MFYGIIKWLNLDTGGTNKIVCTPPGTGAEDIIHQAGSGCNREEGVLEKKVIEICQEVDAFIAKYLAESILHKVSYDTLEKKYGILPVSRNSFYRKRRIAVKKIKQK